MIVARHFARIFLQNSFNLGLRTIICPEIDAAIGDEIEVTKEKILNKSTGRSFNIISLPEGRQTIINAVGLIPFTRQQLLRKKQSA